MGLSLCRQRTEGKPELMRKVVGPSEDWRRCRIDQREHSSNSSGFPWYKAGQGDTVVVVVAVVRSRGLFGSWVDEKVCGEGVVEVKGLEGGRLMTVVAMVVLSLSCSSLFLIQSLSRSL